MARLLYGGRNSLIIGIGSALICCFLATIVGARRRASSAASSTRILSRLLDVMWAFPVYLLAISISIVALTSGLDLGLVTLERRQPLDADRDHRHHLHPVRRAPDPRPGAVGAREGVRRGGHRARARPTGA